YAEIRQLPDATGDSVPLVLVNRVAAEKGFHSVTIDHHRAARSAMEYLVALGHRRIALVSGDAQADHIKPRHQAYLDVLAENGIRPEPGWMLENLAWNGEQRKAQIASLLSQHKPTAFFLPTGRFEAAVLVTLHQLGCSIPGDISLASFDDVPNPLHPLVPLMTTVRLPLASLGQSAVRLLDRVRRDRPEFPIVETLETELVVRDSCKRLR
ncbi:LacI family transcriptional regulator, partial [bacterium]|nr:LacI family transcriptional regulator [bacterium]